MMAQASRIHKCNVGRDTSCKRLSSRLVRLPAVPLRHRGASVVAQAGKQGKSTGNETLDGVMDVGRNLVDSASDLVPSSVPRPVAKGGVAVAGVLIVFWLMQKVLSTLLTIALLGGAAWLYFRSSSGGDGDSGSGGGGGRSGQDEDPSDPLSEARRIMDKYR